MRLEREKGMVVVEVRERLKEINKMNGKKGRVETWNDPSLCNPIIRH